MKNVCSFVKLTPGKSSSFWMFLISRSVTISSASTSHKFSSNVKSPSTSSRTGWPLYSTARL